jgi:hypothetical protein
MSKKKTKQQIRIGSFVETTPFLRASETPFQGVIIDRFENWMFIKGYGEIYCEDIDSLRVVKKPRDFRINCKREPKIVVGSIVSSTNSDKAKVIKIVEGQWCIIRDVESEEIFPEALEGVESV